jgi:hypothetical protein
MCEQVISIFFFAPLKAVLCLWQKHQRALEKPTISLPVTVWSSSHCTKGTLTATENMTFSPG